MWECPKCGEQIENRFDSCWKCAKPNLPPDQDIRATRKPGWSLVLTYWRRGWLVLLLCFCMGLCWEGVDAMLSGLERNGRGGTLGVVLLTVLLMPPLAYWLFILFFGAEAWPLPEEDSKLSRLSREEEAFALLRHASRLEARGNIEQALLEYEQVVGRFPGTEAGRDAQRSIESLRAKMG